MTAQRLALTERLRARLRPLALAVGILISCGLPITYGALEYSSLSAEADGLAREVAAEIPQRSFEMMVADFVPGRPIRQVRVLDAKGEPIPGHVYSAPRGWWEVGPPVGHAPRRRPQGSTGPGVISW